MTDGKASRSCPRMFRPDADGGDGFACKPPHVAGLRLVRITACAKNNTDRKVREGLYSTADDGAVTSFAMAGNTLRFPRIQYHWRYRAIGLRLAAPRRPHASR
ncbi:hypothetical protein [Paracoccus mutanolyticus]|uniref:hypothetical protein n=1 Tax=Paracoccus mutanolyticus TaxID=1499308 RepID=UPI001CB94FE6|nr:hypothetical protein [Paracoccus mutanolyticus]